MVNAGEAARAIRAELDRLGLADWTFHYDSARVRFGRCTPSTRTITLSQALVQVNDWPAVLDVTRHEAAHALVGPGKGHGRTWQLKALEIGARPERCYRTAEVVAVAQPWSLVCPACGYAEGRTRRPGARGYIHKRDGGRMEVQRNAKLETA